MGKLSRLIALVTCPYHLYNMAKIIKKTYGIYGMVEHSILIGPSNNIRIDFCNGRMTTRGVEPCTFTTDNASIQEMIERTKKFKEKYIKLVRKEEIVIPDEPTEESPRDEKPSDTPDEVQHTDTQDKGATFAGVKNSQQAKGVLMEVYGVSMSELPNVEAVRAKAEELGLSFPNWK